LKHRIASLSGLLLLLLCVLSLPAPPAAAAQDLDVLLTNDDGFDAVGIRTVRDALVAAGHRVTIVAPLENRSGSGMSVTTSGAIDYYRQEEGVWAVDGTPADAVTLGLVHVLRERPPDLVISGANFGHNVGADVGASGTVGAAVTATRAGVPAIALSVAVDGRQAGGDPPFRGTVEAFEPAAALLVEIVRQLAETGGAGLLPPRTVLNVNYPAVGAGEPEGVRFAALSSLRGFRQVFSVAGATGPARIETVPANADRAEEGSDLALVAAGYATISVLDGDWDAGPPSWEPMLRRLIIER
jgi:5'-nucleotidase